MASQRPRQSFYEAMNASYIERMARFQQTKYTFKLATSTHPTETDLAALSQKLIDQCYETYYEEEMITCKLLSMQGGLIQSRCNQVFMFSNETT